MTGGFVSGGGKVLPVWGPPTRRPGRTAVGGGGAVRRSARRGPTGGCQRWYVGGKAPVAQVSGMFSASLTSATKLIFPLHRSQVSTSIFRHRRINSCHGRYRQRCVGGFADSSSFGGSEWQSGSATSVDAVDGAIAAGGGDGTISDRHLLCGASTPP
jgi:hypothetical protein